jgi:dihydroorotate dehydrogenase (fumarate)
VSIDLSSRYLGIWLDGPVVVSACPLSEHLETLKRLEEAGASAAVFPSLFEEQIEQEELEIHGLYELGAESFGEALSYFPEMKDYNIGPDGYLKRLAAAREAVKIPVIGSLNGATTGGWVRYAKLIEDTGADALELNIYFVAADLDMSSHDVEQRYLDLVDDVRSSVSIPLAVKVAPFFSAFGNMARRLVDAGANGLVLFNRFVHPDIDLEQLKVFPNLKLSTSWESRLPLTWVALLRGRLGGASLAASGGVHTADDVLKLVLAGADVAMTASSLYRNGPEHVRALLDGVTEWMRDNGYTSLEQMKGSMSQEHCPDPTAFERVNYMRTIASYTGRREI